MSLNGILSAISAHPEYKRHLALMSKFDANLSGVPQATVRQGARPGYIGALWRQQSCPMMVLTPRPDDARRLHDQLLTYLGEEAPVYLLPEPEVLPFERLAVDSNTTNQRLAALAALAASANGSCPLVVTSVGAALLKTLPPTAMTGPEAAVTAPYRVAVGERIGLNRLLTQWVELGYRNEPLVETPGSFSHRGGIIDVFPPNCELPFRIELFDDEIDTIRLFDPYSQRSIREVKEALLIPAQEQLPSIANRALSNQLIASMDFTTCNEDAKERIEDEIAHLFTDPDRETLSFYNGLLNGTNLLEYLTDSSWPDSSWVILERSSQIDSEALELEERFDRMRATREERGDLPKHFPSPYVAWADFAAQLEKKRRLLLQSWVSAEEDRIFEPAVPYYGRLEQLASDAQRYQSDGTAVVAVTQHAARLAEILEEAGAGATLSEGLEEVPQPGHIYVVPGSLREGWTLTTPQSRPGSPRIDEAGNNGLCSVTLLTDAELFGTVKERRYRRTRRAEHGQDVVLADLVEGSFVVHIDHGVARFAGTTKMGEDGEEKEYLVLEYAEQDKLYVPTGHLDRVSSYIGALDRPPSLTRLSAGDWARVKERVKGATRELAEELLRMHAARELAEGYEFSPDTTWQKELEDSFPYEETPDQAQAIDQVKADM